MFVNPDWNEYDPEKKYTHISKLQPNICTAGKWDGKPQYSNFFFVKFFYIFKFCRAMRYELLLQILYLLFT